jgi:hypothetical protein
MTIIKHLALILSRLSVCRRKGGIMSLRGFVVVVLCLAVATILFPERVEAVRILPQAQRSAPDTVLSSLLLHNADAPDHSLFNYSSSSLLEHRILSSNVDVPFPASPDEHEVTSLPLMSADVLTTKHWAGLLPASDQADKYLFYWLFAPDTTQNTDIAEKDIPLLIWLNGEY